MFELEPLINKTVAFRYKGKVLEFDLSHALFSSFDVDAGTKLLLKEVAQDPVLNAASHILDAGCGTGVIGISLAAALPSARFVLEDRDTLACEFSFHNCKKNGISASLFSLDGTLRCKSEGAVRTGAASEAECTITQETDASQILIRPGLLAEQSRLGEVGGYDMVLSNVPAKAGPSVLTAFFESCEKQLLRPTGRLAFVIVNTLVDVAEKWCAASSMWLVRKTRGPSHTVFILEKCASAESRTNLEKRTDQIQNKVQDHEYDHRFQDIELYVRSNANFVLGKRHPISFNANGVWGMPEFDTPSYATQLAVETVESLPGVEANHSPGPSDPVAPEKNLLVYEPGIGLSTIWMAQVFLPSRIDLVSRNVLALFATKFNLRSTSVLYSAQHDSLPQKVFLYSATETDRIPAQKSNLIVWFCDEIPEYNYIDGTFSALSNLLSPGGVAAIVGSNAAIGRFEKHRPNTLRRLGGKKLKGFSSLAFLRLD
jgi:hypothetical protein